MHIVFWEPAIYQYARNIHISNQMNVYTVCTWLLTTYFSERCTLGWIILFSTRSWKGWTSSVCSCYKLSFVNQYYNESCFICFWTQSSLMSLSTHVYAEMSTLFGQAALMSAQLHRFCSSEMLFWISWIMLYVYGFKSKH